MFFSKIPFLTTFCVVIFFPRSVFFFPRKRLNFTQSLVSNLCIFFFGTGKKNTLFLLTHSSLDENVTKVIFSRNKKKKYGTFALMGQNMT